MNSEPLTAFVQQRRFDFTVPIFEASGHPAPGSEKAVSRARSASEQTSSPSAREGLAVIPLGRVTTAFSMSEAAAAPSLGFVSPSSRTSRLKSKPVGLEAALEVGCAAIVGLKPRRAQSIIPWVRASPLAKIPGACQESTSKTVPSDPRQARGRVSRGRSEMLTAPPRSESWAGLAGTPQRVSSAP